MGLLPQTAEGLGLRAHSDLAVPGEARAPGPLGGSWNHLASFFSASGFFLRGQQSFLWAVSRRHPSSKCAPKVTHCKGWLAGPLC